MTQASETLDPLEAPAASYPTITRVLIALEARLAACPACGAPAYHTAHKPFQNAEGQGTLLRVAFACEAGAALMVTPAARVHAYAVEPCRETVSIHMRRIAQEAMVYGEEADAT